MSQSQIPVAVLGATAEQIEFIGLVALEDPVRPDVPAGLVAVIRKMMAKAIAEKNETFWNELIWREFFMQILWHFPHTINQSFKSKRFFCFRNSRIRPFSGQRIYPARCGGHGYPPD